VLTLEHAVHQHLRLQQLLQPTFLLCCLVRKIRRNFALQVHITFRLELVHIAHAPFVVMWL